MTVLQIRIYTCVPEWMIPSFLYIASSSLIDPDCSHVSVQQYSNQFLCSVGVFFLDVNALNNFLRIPWIIFPVKKYFWLCGTHKRRKHSTWNYITMTKTSPFNITVTALNYALFKKLPQNYVGAMFILFALITNKQWLCGCCCMISSDRFK